jgi:aspartate aminotransferase
LNIGHRILKHEVAMEAVKNIDLTILEYSHSAGNEAIEQNYLLLTLSKVYQ